MARPTKPCVQVNGRAVNGVWKSTRGFYLVNPFKQGDDKREFFNDLQRAIARRDELRGIKPTVRSKTPEQVYHDALSHGIDPEYLDEHPEVVESFGGGVKVNPDYPDRDLAVRLMFGLPTRSDDDHAPAPPLVNGLRVAEIGTTYKAWYADDRENVSALKSKARAFNETQTRRETEPDPKKGGLTKKEKRRKNPRRKQWIDFGAMVKCR